MKTVPTKFEPRFGAFVLETLTVGMYGEPKSALREYVQNSFDAIRQAIAAGILKSGSGKIELTLAADRSSLTIRDNGTGMSSGSAAQELAAVGSSSKDFRRDAGFRGIGRLSGIVFSDEVIFLTKVKGESKETKVVFDAKRLREMISPTHGSEADAADVLQKCVTATISDGHDLKSHYFAVHLNHLSNAPIECIDPTALRSYLSQVAPVPYHTDFPFTAQIKNAVTKAGLPVDEVSVHVRDDGKTSIGVFKPYRKNYEVQGRSISLTGCKIVESPSKRWIAWIGVKKTSGAYSEVDVRGIRVRLRNIEVGGEKLMRDLFASSKERRSHQRFSDWYVGEVFVNPRWVIPNARRDNFEEDRNWIEASTELKEKICVEYGRLAYKISKDDQLSPENIEKKVAKLEKTFQKLKSTSTKKIISGFWKGMIDAEERVATAAEGAELQVQAKLRAVNDRLFMLSKAFSKKFSSERPRTVDLNKIHEQVREELIEELIAAFRKRLDATTFDKVRRIVRDVTGKDDL